MYLTQHSLPRVLRSFVAAGLKLQLETEEAHEKDHPRRDGDIPWHPTLAYAAGPADYIPHPDLDPSLVAMVFTACLSAQAFDRLTHGMRKMSSQHGPGGALLLVLRNGYSIGVS
jgi:hypothetical protein